MSDSLFSASWHRVASLTPQLRGHVHIHRHQYRGQRWYLLQDRFSQRSYRFTPAAYFIIGLMDGHRNVEAIWQAAMTKLGDDAPTQDEMIRLLSQLHSADALRCDIPPDTSELFQRYRRQKRAGRMSRFMNPLALRLRLLDPDRFLAKTLCCVRPLFGKFGALLWLLVVGSGIVLAGLHWSELTENVSDRVLAPQNLLLLWLMFPIVKAAHEFGHAYAVKVWGGEVHEMGIMFLVLMPVPYVDASSANAFREKRKRIIVSAAGMIVELFLATLALFVWLSVEPGTVRAMAYNVVLIASVSTVLFNANPLLRFDGYYILSDFIEIPNLGTRSTKYIGYLCQRYLFGLKDLEKYSASKGERAWYVGYGVASYFYRMAVMAAIALFIASKFFFIGVMLAVWAIFVSIIVPMMKAISNLLTSVQIRPKRTRAIVTVSAMVCITLGSIISLPVPCWTRAEGVVWVSSDNMVRAATDCFIDKVMTESGSHVRSGDALIGCHDMSLLTHINVLRGRFEELSVQYRAELQSDRVQAGITREELRSVAAELARELEKAKGLVIRSQADGMFVVPNAEDLPNRYIRKGELLAYTLNPAITTAQVIVPQADIDVVRRRTLGVEVRLADRIADVMPAVVEQEVPAATDELPSLTLTRQGGGIIVTDPLETDEAKAFKKFFQLDISFTRMTDSVNVGERVYVRFDHGFEPLASQWYRSLRQLFLARFNV
jgi:putative peptide zinc metalloprotease protein